MNKIQLQDIPNDHEGKAKKILEEKEQQRQRTIAAYPESAKPILFELSQVGLDVKLIEDLYNKRYDYRRAIPILLRWLPRVENPGVKEAIVRALSVPWARHTEASALLIEQYRKSDKHLGLKWAISNALSVVADDAVLSDIVGLINDSSHGKAREMLVVALGNMKDIRTQDVLIEILNDEELAGYAIIALGKLKSKKAYSAIEHFLTHRKAWVRQEAKKVLARISKAAK